MFATQCLNGGWGIFTLIASTSYFVHVHVACVLHPPLLASVCKGDLLWHVVVGDVQSLQRLQFCQCRWNTEDQTHQRTAMQWLWSTYVGVCTRTHAWATCMWMRAHHKTNMATLGSQSMLQLYMYMCLLVVFSFIQQPHNCNAAIQRFRYFTCTCTCDKLSILMEEN